jgi:hypothetical protein
LAQALHDDEETVPNEKKESHQAKNKIEANSSVPADIRFQVKTKPPMDVPSCSSIVAGVTAQATPVGDDEELPEDRFHKRDMMSMHILDQRKKDKVEKAKKAETERAARRAENEAKQAAAKAAGKSWRDMYPGEPETTYVDMAEMLADTKAATDAIDVQATAAAMETSAAAVRAAEAWKQETKLNLSSSLAFDLL